MNRRKFLATLGAATTVKKFVEPQAAGQIAQENPPEENLFTTVRFPYVQNINTYRASVIWVTEQPGTGIVQYSSDGTNYRDVPARVRVYTRSETGYLATLYQYQADLTGLTPDTDYFYGATLNGAAVPNAGETRFRTAVTDGAFKFLVFGDSGFGSEEQFAISQRILPERPAFVIHTGDIVYTHNLVGAGPFVVYQTRYLNYYAGSMCSVPFFPCPGNHDYDIGALAPYLAIHSVPTESVPPADRGRYYSFDWGNVHFVSLDGHLSLERAISQGGAMLRWLENDLRSTRQFWRVVYFHYPPYSTGTNENDPKSGLIRQWVVPIMERHGVQLVLSGHEHSYQRAFTLRRGSMVAPNTGTTYLTTGGGGAILYPIVRKPIVEAANFAYHYLRAEVRGTSMSIRAIQHNGTTELDVINLRPLPRFSDEAGIPPVSFQPRPTAGSFIRIMGRSLASSESLVCTPNAPSTMGDATVTINGQPIQLLYASPTQLYGRLPFTVEGNITVRVTTPNGSAEVSVNPG